MNKKIWDLYAPIYEKAMEEYMDFLESHGWRIVNAREMKARIPIAYVECVRQKDVPK